MPRQPKPPSLDDPDQPSARQRRRCLVSVTVHTISPTERVRTLHHEGGQLVIRERLRTLPGGQAWCLVGCERLDGRRRVAHWPTGGAS